MARRYDGGVVIESRVYACDDGHMWRVFREPGSPAAESDETCEFGHPAVTCTHEPLAAGIDIIFRPAERVVDRVKGQVHGRSRFFLVLRDLRSGAEVSSLRDYPWEQAVEVGAALRQLEPERALTKFRTLRL